MRAWQQPFTLLSMSRARLCVLAVVVVLTAALVSGCGKQGPNEQFVARFNALCRQWQNSREPETPPALRELNQLIKADRSLSVERQWRTYATAKRQLERTMTPLLNRVFTEIDDPRALDQYRELYRRDLRLYEGERALGLRQAPCIRAPIRPPIGG